MRNHIAVVLTTILLGTALSAVTAPQAMAAVSTLTPVADSYVRSDQPTSNFGADITIKVDGSPSTVSYLRFDVAVKPTKATLKVFTPTSSTTPINVRSVADNTWTEAGLNYNNKPAVGSVAIASPTPIAANSTLSYDVTSLVTGTGLVSFAIDTTSSTSKSPPSRENATVANRPQLVIETGTTPTDPSTVIAVGGDVACATTEPNYGLAGAGVGGAPPTGSCHMQATAKLIKAMNPQQVFALGDLQYNSGSLANFNASYGETQKSWGGFKSKTRPVVGNHEYGTGGAAGYFSYFGDAATPLQPGCRSNCNGYYSFDVPVGTTKWHVAVINSECTRIGGGVGCAVNSAQYNWLAGDLSKNAGTVCTAVLTHKPRWSSNSFNTPDIQPLVDLMYANGVDLLLAGHAHSYERFDRQTNTGQRVTASTAKGIRQIIVGTGGRDSQGFGTVAANSLVRKNRIFGAMKLTLLPTGYTWAFVPDPETPFADSGSGTCI